MMKAFNVLDREVDVHRNFLLEASAGTGKTFSIENIIVRLLLEKEALSLEQILVVTFTRAAVRDLKVRIRGNIEKSLAFLVDRSKSEGPDFLLKIKEEGSSALEKAIRRLKQALLLFEQAQIYTIHSFCAGMLSENVFEGDLRIDSISGEEFCSKEKIRSIIRDFFRTEIKPELYSPAQLKLILKQHQHSQEELENALSDLTAKNIEIENPPAYDQLFNEFNLIMRKLIVEENLSSDMFIDAFMQYAPRFKNIVNIKKVIKSDILEKAQKTATLFDKSSWTKDDLDWLITDQLSTFTAISEDKLNAKWKKSNDADRFIQICTRLRNELFPFVSSAKIMIRMAYDCKRLIKSRFMNEESLGFDDILNAMKNALDNGSFVERVRNKYSAALVDEFQDTDPLQWEIFERLFLKSGRLYLVGDPKQSIYAFRQADIYTYLKAAEAIGSHNHASLDTNFRSQSDLVHALNYLFSNASDSGFLDLPRINSKLEYTPVNHAPKAAGKQINDGLGSIQFLITEDHRKGKYPLEDLEEQKFFPYIAREIQKLRLNHGVSLKDIAVLVSDRYQESRISEYLKQYKIPTLKQRGRSIVYSNAIPALLEVVKGIADPKRESALKLALGGNIIQWNHQQIRNIADIDILTNAIEKFTHYKREFEKNGFFSFYNELISSAWHNDKSTVLERLLQQESGLDFLNELNEIVNCILEYECHHSLTLESLVDFLSDFQSHYNEEKQIYSSSDLQNDAVNVMTIHASKGLEFSIVFSLGLCKRNKMNSDFMTICEKGKLQLAAITDQTSNHYLQYCQELDAEKLRLLYVAMTRAKHRLYCPVAILPNIKEADTAESSPMELFLCKLGLGQTDYKGFLNFVENSGADIGASLLDGEIICDVLQEELSIELQRPKSVSIPGEPLFIKSFSTLCMENANFGSFNYEILNAPHDFKTKVKSPHNLPAGSDAGNLLHKLLEKISFEQIAKANKPLDFLPFVQTYTSGTEFFGWDHAISEILYNAVKTNIFDGFSLADVNPNNICREPEFLYQNSIAGDTGYLKGFIDVIFEHKGKYYILDWKSNWLGDNITSYNYSNLKQAMDSNNYNLQSEIYTEALKKYISYFNTRPFDEIFGGIYYIFLRGLCVDYGNQFGVYKVS